MGTKACRSEMLQEQGSLPTLLGFAHLPESPRVCPEQRNDSPVCSATAIHTVQAVTSHGFAVILNFLSQEIRKRTGQTSIIHIETQSPVCDPVLLEKHRGAVSLL